MNIKTAIATILGLAIVFIAKADHASGSCLNACEIYNLTVEKGSCTFDSTYLLTVDFNVVNAGSDSFNLWGNGKLLGRFAYNDRPLSISNFPKSGNNQDWIKVCDVTVGSCCRTLEFTSQSCTCKIYELELTKGDCTSDSTYVLHVNFLVANPASDSFDLFANGKLFGTYAYAQLPLTITHFPKSGSVYDWIKLFDHGDPDCFKGLEFKSQECGNPPCSFENFKIEKGDCASDSTYLLAVQFSPVNPGSDSFDVWANGKYFGRFPYAKLPLVIPQFLKSGGTNDWIKVCDSKKTDCCKVLEFLSKECGAPCMITELVAKKAPCNPDGKFMVTLDFKVKNQKANSFKVFGNGIQHGVFTYDSLPIQIGPLPGDCTTPWEFVVKDIEDPSCFAVLEMGKVCCGECKIEELKVEKGDCTSDSTYVLDIQFQHMASSGDSFRVFANGIYFGMYPYILPLTIPDFPKSGNPLDWIKICDKSKETCCATKEFPTQPCGVKPCAILELEVEKNCETDSVFYATLNFLPQQVGVEGFWLKGNGVVYGNYSYGQLPLTIGPLAANCIKHYEFLVQDKTYETCKKAIELGVVCCEDSVCDISDLVLDAGACGPDDTWPLSINFNIQHPGNDLFEVWVNGIYEGYYPIGQLPVQIAGLPSSGQEYDSVRVCINDRPDCCIEGTVLAPECLTDPKKEQTAAFLIGGRVYKQVIPNGWTQITTVDLYDAAGRLVYRSAETFMKPGETHRMDTKLTPGIYMIVADTDKGRSTGRIFVP